MALSYKWSDAEDVLDAVCKACKDSNIALDNKASTLEKLKKTDILGVFDGECVGAVLFVEQEFHGAIIKKYRGKWITKRFIEIVLNEKCKRGGLKTTINGASELIRKSVHRFCDKYGIEVIK